LEVDTLSLRFALEGQPVYWMALVAIPTPVLDKLRKITFNFLWSGSKDQHKLHLCNWETLANQKSRVDGELEIFLISTKPWLPILSGVH
jgi:hypothetical protein